MGAIRVCRIVKEPRAPGGTRTRVAALRVRCPCRWTTSAILSVGPEGLEPSPGGLRVRCAAASTLIPSSSSSRRGGSRTLDLTLIRGLLSPLSYAPANRAEGTRTLTCRIKSPVCCRYTTTPMLGRAYAFQPCRASFAPLLVRASGSPESRTQRHAVISRFGQPALDYRAMCQSGWQDSNLRSRAPKARGFAATLHPACQSERPDLNRRSPGPRARRDTQASLRSVVSSPCGSRTRLCGLERARILEPIDERAVAHFHAVTRSRTFTQWVGRCSNPRLRLFRPPLHHLSYQPNKKSPMSL